MPSPGVAVLIWLVAGTLAWTGAASFIELGVVIPKNGGVQEYLKVCYGDYLGFLFTWIWIAISKPCGMAMIAMIFAENLSVVAMPVGVLSPWEVKSLAILGLALITFTNCLGTIAGARAANAFLILKLLALFSIAATGIIVGVTGLTLRSQHLDGLQVIQIRNVRPCSTGLKQASTLLPSTAHFSATVDESR